MRLICLPLLALALSANAQTPPRKQIVEDLRLDGVIEDFPSILRVAVGPRGQIAVFVRQGQSLRLYDSAGAKVAAFGRTGSGPGESRTVNEIGFKADTVWMYDPSLLRLTYVTPVGKLLRHEVLSPSLNIGALPDAGGNVTGAMYRFAPQRMLPDGRILAYTDVATGRDDRGKIATEGRIVVANVDGSNRKVVGHTIGSNGVTQVQVRDADDRVFTAGIPFLTAPSLVKTSDGTRFGYLTHKLTERGGTYSIRIVRSTGDTALSRDYPFVGERIPDALRDSMIGRLRFVRSGNSLLYPTPIAAKLEALVRPLTPRVYRAVEELFLGRDNTTWLKKRETKAGVEYLSLNERGDPLFFVLLPAKATLVEASRSTLWVTLLDDDDLPSLVRYRVR